MAKRTAYCPSCDCLTVHTSGPFTEDKTRSQVNRTIKTHGVWAIFWILEAASDYSYWRCLSCGEFMKASSPFEAIGGFKGMTWKRAAVYAALVVALVICAGLVVNSAVAKKTSSQVGAP